MYTIYHVYNSILTDEMGDLRVQVQLLEEKNTKYMQEQLEMEEVCIGTSIIGNCLFFIKRVIFDWIVGFSIKW